jgi:hypothetical protein
MNPLYIDLMIRERQREAAAEADRRRLLAIYAAHNPNRVDRLLFALGTTLVRLGEHLRRRCQPDADLNATPCRGR